MLPGEITSLGFKSPRRCKSSDVTLFGTHYLYEVLTVTEHMLGENLKRVHEFTYRIVMCFLGSKDKIHLKYRTSKTKHPLEIRTRIQIF